ncbi:MAG: hypothetical protein VX733_07850 [Candidatus Latescibacterota bacterium]|nr:hypothetical protein [Candidatus Latescibacterota bacterium]
MSGRAAQTITSETPSLSWVMEQCIHAHLAVAETILAALAQTQ